MSAPTRFATDYAKRVSKCQKCKMQLEKGILRLAKIIPNFFMAQKDDSKPPPDMKQYFHKDCLFEMLFKARLTTKVIETTDEIEGFKDIGEEDQEMIKKLVEELMEKRSKDEETSSKTPKKTPAKKKAVEAQETPSSRKRKTDDDSGTKNKKAKEEVEKPKEIDEKSKYNSFYKFAKFCEVISNISSSSEKRSTITSLVNKADFDGEVLVWLKFLLREEDKKKYGVKKRDIIQYFAKILSIEESEISNDVEKTEDVSLSVRNAIEKVKKNDKSDWSIQKVDRYLEKLTELEGDDAKMSHFKFATKRLSPLEVQYLIRLSLKDLNIELSTKDVLKGLHPDAYNAFEEDRNVEELVKKFEKGTLGRTKKESKPKKGGNPKKGKKVELDDDEDSEVEASDSDDSLSEDSDIGSDDEEISETESSDVSDISSSDEDVTEETYKENINKGKMAQGTRSRPRAGNGQVVKKQECPDDMEPCKYGAECYRKNKEHKEQFWHPEK